MKFDMPPLVKLSERLLVDVEQAVRRFARFHKYTFGSKLRETAFALAQSANKAWTDREHRADWINRLDTGVDDVKLLLQLGSRLHAFASFRQYEMLARLASDVGKQAGGWKKQHPKALNEQPRGAAIADAAQTETLEEYSRAECATGLYIQEVNV